MQPIRIEEKAAVHLIGCQTRFISGLSPDTNAPGVIGPLWGTLHGRLPEIEQTHPTTLYGYCFPLHSKEPRTHEDELFYLAGAAAPEGAPVAEGLCELHTEAGLYAVFEHHGPIERFLVTVRAIYEDWLPTSGYVGNGAGDVEVYDERWRDGGKDSVVECWIGIRPARSPGLARTSAGDERVRA